MFLRKLFFTQFRIGKNGELFKIYKIRTMVDSDESKYSPTEENDFRIKRGARWMRRWSIDEIPQILNILKGEMTIIGPRPLTEQDYDKLPIELRQMRINQKPGFFSPKYYSTNPFGHLVDIEMEKKYLTERLNNPLRTNIKFIIVIIYNFLFRKVRSR